ncbi:zinc finger, CCHC-type containing protein [Tanacetum coccineum]|uniref:Zinc finger, CCHC-type containing protein n=1 Tax=Tanacetum coccineum TaxID=301880 RepID=A0ABQ5I109_9ASTR
MVKIGKECACVYFKYSIRDQASSWLERLPAGSITTWEDPTTRFLAQLFPSGRTAKLRNDILMFQQHQGKSLFEAWTCFKDLLQKVPHYSIDLWLQAEEKEREREGNPEDTNTMAHNEEQRNTSQLELKDTTAIGNLGPNKDDERIEWLDVEEPLYLVDTSEESVYESLINEMPKCSLNYDFRIKKGDPRNL